MDDEAGRGVLDHLETTVMELLDRDHPVIPLSYVRPYLADLLYNEDRDL